jgi:hypothetical protein
MVMTVILTHFILELDFFVRDYILETCLPTASFDVTRTVAPSLDRRAQMPRRARPASDRLFRAPFVKTPFTSPSIDHAFLRIDRSTVSHTNGRGVGE